MTSDTKPLREPSLHLNSVVSRVVVGGAGMLLALTAVALAVLIDPELGDVPKADIAWLAALLGVFGIGCYAFLAALERFDTKRALRKTAVALACVLAALVLLYGIALLIALIGSLISGAIESLGSRDGDETDSSGDKSDTSHSGGYHGGFTFGDSSELTPSSSSGRGHSSTHHLRCLRCGAPTMGGLCEYCRGAQSLLG